LQRPGRGKATDDGRSLAFSGSKTLRGSVLGNSSRIVTATINWRFRAAQAAP
jgi:hypothetical protein